jgi:hypothetical protein
MSKLIPRRTIDTIRNNVDVALDIAGIVCTLYIPTNTSYATEEKLDMWSEKEDLSFLSYSSLVYLDWTPKTKRLKQLGLFVEGTTPILGRFGNKATPLTGSQAGQLIEVDIVKRSYFRIVPEFVPNDYSGVEDFEVVDIATDSIHDAVLTKMYSIAPRRIKR